MKHLQWFSIMVIYFAALFFLVDLHAKWHRDTDRKVADPEPEKPEAIATLEPTDSPITLFEAIPVSDEPKAIRLAGGKILLPIIYKDSGGRR